MTEKDKDFLVVLHKDGVRVALPKFGEATLVEARKIAWSVDVLVHRPVIVRVVECPVAKRRDPPPEE